ncbi:hypothetical protein MD484_g7621, partial [Candolleomyces efflorescens]
MSSPEKVLALTGAMVKIGSGPRDPDFNRQITKDEPFFTPQFIDTLADVHSTPTAVKSGPDAETKVFDIVDPFNSQEAEPSSPITKEYITMSSSSPRQAKSSSSLDCSQYIKSQSEVDRDKKEAAEEKAKAREEAEKKAKEEAEEKTKGDKAKVKEGKKALKPGLKAQGKKKKVTRRRAQTALDKKSDIECNKLYRSQAWKQGRKGTDGKKKS